MLNGKTSRGRGSGGGTNRELPVRIAPERKAVLTETVAVATFVPSIEEDAGEMSHVECIGAPVHVHVIVCLKPPVGAAETEKLADCPAVMVVPDGAAVTL